MNRSNGRKNNELRPIRFEVDFMKFAQSSVLSCYGDTRVIVSATLENDVPAFLKEREEGWITAEYGLLPASCGKRIQRPVKGIDGRSQEIQRLIGRTLRVVVDRKLFPGCSIVIDCDVLQGDGGTRTAAISGSILAVRRLFDSLLKKGEISEHPARTLLGAVSVGIVNGNILLDLDYSEDSQAEVDMNLVMTEKGEWIELQGTAEKQPFSHQQLSGMLDFGEQGIKEIMEIQRQVLTCC